MGLITFLADGGWVLSGVVGWGWGNNIPGRWQLVSQSELQKKGTGLTVREADDAERQRVGSPRELPSASAWNTLEQLEQMAQKRREKKKTLAEQKEKTKRIRDEA